MIQIQDFLSLNFIFIFRVPEWKKTITQFIFIASWVTIGTFFGSKLLLFTDKITLKIILLGMLFFAIITSNKKLIKVKHYGEKDKFVQAIFGLIAGIMGGAVNIAVPVLTMYFVNTDYTPGVMSQAFNLCFIFSKISQAIILAVSGEFGIREIVLGLFLCGVAYIFQKPGLKLQDKISRETYKRYLNISTIIMAILIFLDIFYYIFRYRL